MKKLFTIIIVFFFLSTITWGQTSISSTGNYSHNDGMDLNVTTFSGSNMDFYSGSGSVAVNTSDIGGVPGSSPARWDRTWRIDNSNPGNKIANFTFDWTDYGIGGAPSGSAYVLIGRDAGTSGNWTILSSSPSVGASTVSFNGITINAGDDLDIGLATENQSGSPLPVKLTSFEAELKSDFVALYWATQTETNNAFFEIEKSFDGKEWTSIGTVNGNGTKLTPTEYAFNDYNLNSNICYYRLKQVDQNGDHEHSNIIGVNPDGTPVTSSISAYPTISNAGQSVTIETGLGGVVINVATGKEVIPLQVGINVISDLPAGMYIAISQPTIKDGVVPETQKFIVN